MPGCDYHRRFFFNSLWVLLSESSALFVVGNRKAAFDMKNKNVSKKEHLSNILATLSVELRILKNPLKKSYPGYGTKLYCPVGWGCRILRLHLCRAVRPPNECPRYDTKQSDGEAPVMLELWGMQSIPSLPSLPGPLYLLVK